MESNGESGRCNRRRSAWFIFSASVLTLTWTYAVAAQKPSQRSEESRVEALQTSAAHGDAIAMYRLGRRYEYGRGVSKDAAKARLWLEKASSAGNAAAMNELGSMCEEGKGKARDYGEARRWYVRSAKLGLRGRNGQPCVTLRARSWSAEGLQARVALVPEGCRSPQCRWHERSWLDVRQRRGSAAGLSPGPGLVRANDCSASKWPPPDPVALPQ